MASPEIILMGGPPWSGKSSIARKFVAAGQPEGAQHFSIGNLKRDILAGRVESDFKEQLENGPSFDVPEGAVALDAIMGMFDEYMRRNNSPLTLVDGFPRYPNRIGPFQELVRELGVEVLAFCEVQVDMDVLRQRATWKRRGRPEISPFEAELRLKNHFEKIAPTFKILAELYPYYIISSLLPIKDNVAELQEIYRRHTFHDQVISS